MAVTCMGIGTCSSNGLAASSFSNVYMNCGCISRNYFNRLLGESSSCHRQPPFVVSRITKRSISDTSPSLSMVSNGSTWRQYYTTTNSNYKIYRRLGKCLVISPPKATKPRGIIKFLGGAFIGAVPEVTYSYLIGLLASEGYLVISVPYNVTFDHSQAATEVYHNFHSCLDAILADGLPANDLPSTELVGLPLYSVGHSNGALLQVLTGSYFPEKIPKANAVISYNNRPASEAVPYFEQLGPLVSQVMPVMETSPLSSMTKAASDAWRVLLDAAGSVTSDFDKEDMLSLNNFVDQLPSVFNQVAEGISEFKPTPSENLNCFKESYNVKKTLLVKFNFDAIDETDRLEETLRPRIDSIGGKLEKVLLSGSHITPCIQEPKLQVGDVYTPADAIAHRLKNLSLNDTKVLARTIIDWFNRLEEY